MAKGILVITTFLNELMIPGLRYIYLRFAVMLESHWPVKTLTNVLDIDDAAESITRLTHINSPHDNADFIPCHF